MILRYSNGEAEREREMDGEGKEKKNNTRPSSDLHPFAYVAARVSLSLSDAQFNIRINGEMVFKMFTCG